MDEHAAVPECVATEGGPGGDDNDANGMRVAMVCLNGRRDAKGVCEWEEGYGDGGSPSRLVFGESLVHFLVAGSASHQLTKVFGFKTENILFK